MMRLINENDLAEFNKAQLREILAYKWIESEKRKNDIGMLKAASEWTLKYAESFRSFWFSKS